MPKQPGISSKFRTPAVIGHRGAAGYAPENTLAALEKAASLGIDWVEFDVRLTRDRQPILLHDETLERTTNGRGKLSELDWKDVQGLDAGGWFGPAFRGERIPALGDAVRALERLGLGANVEIKTLPGRAAEFGLVIAAFLKEHWPGSLPPPLISSFYRDALAAAREAAPQIARSLIVGGIPADWRQALNDLACEGLHCRHDALTLAQAQSITAAGFSLRCFTVNHRERAQRLFSWGVDAVFSDYPDRVGGI